MDSRTRRAIEDRDGAVDRVRSITWRIGGIAVVGAAVMGAGFAHLIPTHLPQLTPDGTASDGNATTGSGTSNGSGGPQPPAVNPGSGGSRRSHVSSGGS